MFEHVMPERNYIMNSLVNNGVIKIIENWDFFFRKTFTIRCICRCVLLISVYQFIFFRTKDSTDQGYFMAFSIQASL